MHPRAAARTGLGLGLALATLLAGCSPNEPTRPAGSSPGAASPSPRVTVAQVNEHLKQLQTIADANHGTRSLGTPGYAKSADLVETTLKKAGYTVTRQTFTVDQTRVIEQKATVVAGGGPQLDPLIMEGSASTPEAGLKLSVRLPTGSAQGCSASDYDGLKGTVALVQRGTCRFGEKARAAQSAGVSALLVSDTDPKSPALRGQLDAPGATIPVAGLTKASGESLADAVRNGAVVVDLRLRVSNDPIKTDNVIAEMPSGKDAKVLMVGAHLDSVPAGPGINDNGSGVALVLALATQLAASGRADGVRFGFWGAEELGLLGSQHYVKQLDDGARKQITGYLNFDMVASPNGVLGSYGKGPLFDRLKAGISTSGADTVTADIGDASDHAPFGHAGISYAGIFTGAGDRKSAAEQKTFGGQAGQPYDPCYHQACDNLANTSKPEAQQRLQVIADLALGTIEDARPR